MSEFDRLDNFFRKHLLNDSSISKAMDSKDAIFERAIGQVNANSKKKRLWFLPLIGLGFVSLLGVWSIVIQQKQNHEIAALKESIQVLVNRNNALNNQITDAKAKIHSIELSRMNPKSELNIDRSMTVEAASGHKLTNNTAYPYTGKYASISEEVNLGTNAQIVVPIPNTKNEDIENIVKRAVAIDQPSDIAMLSLARTVPMSEAKIYGLPYLVIPKQKIMKNNQLGLYAGGNISKFSMKPSAMPMGKRLMGYEDYHICTDLGVQMSSKLSDKWTLHTRVGYVDIRNNCVYEESMELDYANLIEENMTYRTDLVIQHPLGLENRSVTFGVTENQMKDRDMMEQVKVSQSLGQAYITTGIGYTILQNSKFKLDIGAQGGVGYITKITGEYDVALYMKDEMVHNMNLSSDGTDQINRWNLQAGLALNATYDLSKDYYVNSHLSCNRSLTNLKSTPQYNNYQTYLHNWSVNIGAGKRF